MTKQQPKKKNKKAGYLGVITSALAIAGLAAQQPALAEGKQLQPCPTSPNCVVSMGIDAEDSHYVQPLSYKTGGDKTGIQQVAEVLKDLKRVEIVEQTDDYIHAEFTSAIFRFVDDVEFLQTEEGQIQVRSASRVGYSDLGANGKRVEKIRKLLLADK